MMSARWEIADIGHKLNVLIAAFGNMRGTSRDTEANVAVALPHSNMAVYKPYGTWHLVDSHLPLVL